MKEMSDTASTIHIVKAKRVQDSQTEAVLPEILPRRGVPAFQSPS